MFEYLLSVLTGRFSRESGFDKNSLFRSYFLVFLQAKILYPKKQIVSDLFCKTFSLLKFLLLKKYLFFREEKASIQASIYPTTIPAGKIAKK